MLIALYSDYTTNSTLYQCVSCLPQYEEGVYIGSRAGTVTTMLFDNDHNFLLDSQSSSHSAGGQVSVLYRYLFTLLLLCLTQRHTRVEHIRTHEATAVQDHMYSESIHVKVVRSLSLSGQ